MPSSSAATSATSARSTRSSRSAICSCSSSRRSITGPSPVVAAAQVREDAAVLERVVVRDRAAVGLAERPERPVVLADRHAVDERAHGGRRCVVPAATCSTRSRSWASSARSASWTSIRCRPAACSRGAVACAPGPAPGRSGRVVSSHARSVAEAALRRRASGATASGAGASTTTRARRGALLLGRSARVGDQLARRRRDLLGEAPQVVGGGDRRGCTRSCRSTA